jgi:hypothetical protein
VFRTEVVLRILWQADDKHEQLGFVKHNHIYCSVITYIDSLKDVRQENHQVVRDTVQQHSLRVPNVLTGTVKGP